MQTTTEPASQTLRDDFQKYWEKNIGPLFGWDGKGTAPNATLAFVYARVWRLYRIAVTHEGTVD